MRIRPMRDPAREVLDEGTGTRALRRALGNVAPVERSGQDRLLFGVCAGIARGVGVDVVLVRVAFAALAVLGAGTGVLGAGTGVILYGALVLLLPRAEDPVIPWSARPRAALGLVVALGVFLIGTVIGALTVPMGDLVPVALLTFGVVFVWREMTTGRATDEGRGPALLARVAAGLALLVGGALAFLLNSDRFDALSSALVAAAVVAAGFGLLVGPQLARARAEANAERHARIRSDEHAHVAAQLHDSVLQTLALIQREEDPRRAQSLARRQERDLRAWLYGDEGPGEPATLAGALRAAAADVEEHYGIAVDLVQPSDGPIDEGLSALAAAAREAMTNTGRHAGVGEVSVLARVSDTEASVFVRDRGRGFDPADVGDDRQGVRESIIGRMQRHGGRATIVSTPGGGTEVELVLPRKDT